MKELRPLTIFSCAVEDELRRAVYIYIYIYIYIMVSTTTDIIRITRRSILSSKLIQQLIKDLIKLDYRTGLV